MPSNRLAPSLAAALAALALTGCAKHAAGPTAAAVASSQPAPAASATVSAPAPTTAPSPSHASAAASPSHAPAALPDICRLLTKAEVTGLTGEQVTLMTDDGGSSPTSRYCQWQLSRGQLTITVSLETRENFDIRDRQATPVAGVGAAAYSLSGHLFIWEDGRNVDVYASPKSSDAANLAVERRAAAEVLPRLAGR
ncbi:DUF3558 family protein [Dactylosporangium sp. NPDC051485]|uniref:DUF3558 family protein n=1 Tax=Dactylosporangium sp. NPDC051485 TaxID=3154846 RepID=UPI0034255614